LEPGLEIIDGGKEPITEAGKIDITARDASGKLVVVELKAGAAVRGTRATEAHLPASACEILRR